MTNIHISRHPLVAHKISQLRSKSQNSKEVRELVSEIGSLLFYEATVDLSLEEKGQGQSPLCEYKRVGLKDSVALVPILRSGLSLLEPGLAAFPNAQTHHLGLYRDRVSLQAVEYYNKLPATPSATLCIVLDPMLATGGTARAAISILQDWGAPRIKMISVCASKDGLDQLAAEFPQVHFYIGVVDEELNQHGYILPGIGDSGDRLFNTPH